MKFDNFYEEVPAGVTEPATPAASAAPATDPNKPASEGAKTPEGNQPQYVPYERFSEVNTKAKEANDRAERVESELRAIRENPGSLFGQPRQEEPALDPEVATTLDGWAKSRGYMTKADVQAEEAKKQAQTDLADLKAKHSLTDEQVDQVRQAAHEAGATNARGLEYAYKAVFQDKIIEDKVKEAIAKGENPGASGERPGPGGGGAPSTGGSDKGKKMTMTERIRAAAAKHSQQ